VITTSISVQTQTFITLITTECLVSKFNSSRICRQCGF